MPYDLEDIQEEVTRMSLRAFTALFPRFWYFTVIAATVVVRGATAALSGATRPARDPHTPGYVQATELPDGALPAPDQNGNFIIGPTHTPALELSAPDRPLEGTVVEFTMNSEDSKYFPGIACNQDSQPTP